MHRIDLKSEFLSGQSDNANLDSSTKEPQQLSLNLFLPVTQESLEERLNKIGKRTDPEEIKALIVELCKIKPRSSTELERLLKRKRKYLLDEYLKPLINTKLLEYTNPNNPNAPNQAYRTISK